MYVRVDGAGGAPRQAQVLTAGAGLAIPAGVHSCGQECVFLSSQECVSGLYVYTCVFVHTCVCVCICVFVCVCVCVCVCVVNDIMDECV